MARKPYLEFSVEDRHTGAYLYAKGIKLGLWEAPDTSAGCSACGQTSGDIEAHREDYSKIEPDELVVLCYRCHRVLHMRDRYLDGWEFYREKVREGWRWPATKSITVTANDMKLKRLNGAKRENDPVDRTVLDDIHDGVLLTGTPEERRERMERLYDMKKNNSLGGSLF